MSRTEEEYARCAYEAYRIERGALTHDSRPMPEWEYLGPGVRNGWNEAAKAVLRARREEGCTHG